jgi:curved DNA-binding protein CbpA
MITPTGNITDMTIPLLFQGLRAERKTGTVVFERETAVKKIYFQGGDIIFASSNTEEDRLGECLLRAGTITRAQYDASDEVFKKTGKKYGTVLIQLGFISPQNLVAGVKLQVKHIILSLFAWREGRYTVEEGPLPQADIVPLQMSTGNLVVEGLSGIDWQLVRKSLPQIKTVLRPSTDPSQLFQGAGLTQDQLMVLSLIDGKKNIEELCTQSGIGDFNTLKAVYVLLALRMAEIGEIKTEEEKSFAREIVRETVTAKTASERKLHEPRTAIPSATKETIQQAYDGMETQDHYQVLGIKRSATAQEIKKAYFKLAKLYHPDRHFDPEMSDMKLKLEALFMRIHEAYDTLSTQAKRDQYSSTLSKGVKISSSEKHEPEQSAQKLSAVDQYNEGMRHFKAGNFWGAEEAFRWAVRLDPTNPRFLFYQGLALSRMPRRRHEAEEYFKKVIEMSPNRLEYYMELGNFYLMNNLKAKAHSVFIKAQARGLDSKQLRQSIAAAESAEEAKKEKEPEKKSSSGILKKLFKDKK